MIESDPNSNRLSEQELEQRANIGETAIVQSLAADLPDEPFALTETVSLPEMTTRVVHGRAVRIRRPNTRVVRIKKSPGVKLPDWRAVRIPTDQDPQSNSLE